MALSELLRMVDPSPLMKMADRAAAAPPNPEYGKIRARLPELADLPDDAMARVFGGETAKRSPATPNVAPATPNVAAPPAAGPYADLRQRLPELADLPDDALERILPATARAAKRAPMEALSSIAPMVVAGARSVAPYLPGQQIPSMEDLTKGLEAAELAGSAIQNKFLSTLMDVPDAPPPGGGGLPGMGPGFPAGSEERAFTSELMTDALIAGALHLRSVYGALTNGDLELTPENIEALSRRKVDQRATEMSGQISGGIAILSGTMAAARARQIGGLVQGTFVTHPTLARFLAPSATWGVTLGAEGVFKEAINGVRRGEISLEELGTALLKGTASGLVFGSAQGLASPLAKVAGASAFGFGATLLEGGSVLDATVQASILGGFTALSAPGLTRAQRQGAWLTAGRNLAHASRDAALAKGYSKEEAREIARMATTSLNQAVGAKSGRKLRPGETYNFDDMQRGAQSMDATALEKSYAEIRSKLNTIIGAPAAPPPRELPGPRLPAPEPTTQFTSGAAPGTFVPDPAVAALNRPRSPTAATSGPFPGVFSPKPDAKPLSRGVTIVSRPTTLVTPETIGPQTVDLLKTEMPLLAQTVLGQSLPVEPVAIKEAVDLAVATKAEAIAAGQNPLEAETAGSEAFTRHLEQTDPAAPPAAPADGPRLVDLAAPVSEMEAMAAAPVISEVDFTSRRVKYDRRGVPIRAPGALVATVQIPGGRPARITHQMVVDEAEGLWQEARDARADKVSDLERFVQMYRGIRPFGKDRLTGKVIEAEETRGVPIRFLDPKGFPADELAQMAFDAHVLASPSADLLREELKALEVRGTAQPLGDFYDEALRRLEYYASQELEADPRQFASAGEAPAQYGEFGANLPKETVLDRYNRLVEEGRQQGLTQAQAIREAKRRLGPAASVPPASPDKAQQLELGDPSGVSAFGRGREGERELFERGPRYGEDPKKLQSDAMAKEEGAGRSLPPEEAPKRPGEDIQDILAQLSDRISQGEKLADAIVYLSERLNKMIPEGFLSEENLSKIIPAEQLKAEMEALTTTKSPDSKVPSDILLAKKLIADNYQPENETVDFKIHGIKPVITQFGQVYLDGKPVFLSTGDLMGLMSGDRGRMMAYDSKGDAQEAKSGKRVMGSQLKREMVKVPMWSAVVSGNSVAAEGEFSKLGFPNAISVSPASVHLRKLTRQEYVALGEKDVDSYFPEQPKKPFNPPPPATSGGQAKEIPARTFDPSDPRITRESAFHGSPYRFERFSMDKIGTGLGNQAYGWGLYFSSRKEVAEYYRKMLAPPPEIPAGVRLVLGDAVNMLGFSTPAEAIQALWDETAAGRDWKQTWDVKPERSQKEARAAKIIDEYLAKPPDRGALYKVEIPEPGEYLDWDKPFTDQPAHVRKALEPLREEYRKTDGVKGFYIPDGATGQEIYDEVEMTLQRRDTRAVKPRREDYGQQASKLFNSLGIPGLKYLYFNLRGKGGPGGSHNYVIFDDSRVEIWEVRDRPAEWKAGAPTPGATQLELNLTPATLPPEADLVKPKTTPPPETGVIEIPGAAPQKLEESAWAFEWKKVGALSIPGKKITTPADVAFAFKAISNPLRETVYVAGLRDGRIVGIEYLGMGTIDQVAVYPRGFISSLKRMGATEFVPVHNHPSGRPVPSHEDLSLTDTLRRFGDMIGVRLYGHVVINDTTFGFIDANNGVSVMKHNAYDKTRSIPVLQKFMDWKNQKRGEPGVEIKDPLIAYEVFKGLQQSGGETALHFLDTGNRVIKTLLIPKGSFHPGDIITQADVLGARALISVNSGIETDFNDHKIKQIKRDLAIADLQWWDDIAIDPSVKSGFVSRAATSTAFETPGRYNTAMERYEIPAERPGEATITIHDSAGPTGGGEGYLDEARRAAKRRRGEDYARARKMPPKGETLQDWKAGRRSVMREWLDKFAVVLSSRLWRIKPELKDGIRWMEFSARQEIKKDVEQVKPLMDGWAKVKRGSRADWATMDLALANGDANTYLAIAKKHGVPGDDFRRYRAWADALATKIERSGFQMGYRINHFPRRIRNAKGVLEEFGILNAKAGDLKAKEGTLAGELLLAIENMEGWLGRPMTIPEKANMIDQFTKGAVRSPDLLRRTANMRNREIDRLTPETFRHYDSTPDALLKYITTVEEHIAARNFFAYQGRAFPQLADAEKKAIAAMNDADANQAMRVYNNLNDTIDSFTAGLLEQNQITPAQEEELTKMLKTRFSYEATTGLVGWYRDMVYFTKLTNLIPAITQLEDLGYSVLSAPKQTAPAFARALVPAPLRNIMQGSKITMEDLGLEVLSHEMSEVRDSSTARRVVMRKLFGLSLFRYMDRVGKETPVNAFVDKLRSDLKEGGEARATAEESLLTTLGPEADAAIEDLIAGRTSENILFHAFNQISDQQPLTLSELPEFYLERPGARLFYTLKTFMVRRFNFIRDRVYKAGKGAGVQTDEERKALAQGIGELLKIWIVFGLMGAGPDLMKNFILNRPTKFSDLVIDNMLKATGFHKFHIYNWRRHYSTLGFVGTSAYAAATFVFPPMPFVTDAIKDIAMAGKPVEVAPGVFEPRKLESTANIPIVGTPGSWRFGRRRQWIMERETRDIKRARSGWTPDEVARGRRDKKKKPAATTRIRGL